MPRLSDLKSIKAVRALIATQCLQFIRVEDFLQLGHTVSRSLIYCPAAYFGLHITLHELAGSRMVTVP